MDFYGTRGRCMYYNIYDNIPGEWKLGPMA